MNDVWKILIPIICNAFISLIIVWFTFFIANRKLKAQIKQWKKENDFKEKEFNDSDNKEIRKKQAEGLGLENQKKQLEIDELKRLKKEFQNEINDKNNKINN